MSFFINISLYECSFFKFSGSVDLFFFGMMEQPGLKLVEREAGIVWCVNMRGEDDFRNQLCKCKASCTFSLGFIFAVGFTLAVFLGDGVSNRVGSTCSKDNILIFQGPTSPLPSGIPTYTVEILNACVSGCSISNIHVSCGWFSSARLINPNVFRRLYYDDCLVNNGKPLHPGQSLSFQYANSFRYPLSVSSLVCC
ncbi:hypothetical protein Ancab_033366 [Ancistrocladus abbreviatus]